MRTALYIAIGIILLLTIVAYSCCVIAGEADEKARQIYEEYRRYKEQQNERHDL